MGQLRSRYHAVGRLPVPFAIVMAERIRELQEQQQENIRHAISLKQILLQELQHNIPDCYQQTVPLESASPYILHLLLHCGKKYFQGAIVVRALSALGISIASGSACDSETREPSAVLRAMGIPADSAYTAIRISTGYRSTEDEIKYCVQKLKKTLEEY